MTAKTNVGALKETLKARYLELRKQGAAIRTKSDPIRAERDALVAEYQPRERALHEAIIASEAGLFDIDQEAAEIAKLLGHQTPAFDG
jgi:hypothetical protein